MPKRARILHIQTLGPAVIMHALGDIEMANCKRVINIVLADVTFEGDLGLYLGYFHAPNNMTFFVFDGGEQPMQLS